MRIGQVHLFAEPITADLLIELRPEAGIKRFRMLIEGGFEQNQSVWCMRGKLKVEIAAFQNAFSGYEKEGTIFNEWAAELAIRVPAEQEWSALSSGEITGIQVVIAVEERNRTMKIVGAALAHHVDYASGCMAELRLVAGRDYLESGIDSWLNGAAAPPLI